MTSPYLDRVRPPRETIEELILARERQLAEPIPALQRLRLERDLTFLHGELARIRGQERPAIASNGISKRRRISQR